MSANSEAPPTRKGSASEDWMQVLDNFLDNDESNHNDEESNHHQQQERNIHPVNHSMPTVTNSSHPSTSEEDATTGQTQTVPPENAGGGELFGASAHSASGIKIDDDNLDSNTDLTEEMKTQIRSERKRTREKQRRSDVNSQFSTLTELLQRVEGYDLESDVSDDEDDSETKKRKINSVGVINVAPSNRVDLIARTIAVMDRLHRVNRSLRQNVKGLRKQVKKFTHVGGGDDLKKPGMMNSNFMNNGMQGMMMMMPQLMGGMGQSGGSGGDSQQPMMMMVPMMMPNAMMQQQQQQQQQQNGSGFMPGMNMNTGMGMSGPQNTLPNQMQFQGNSPQGQQVQQCQPGHQNQQHQQSSVTNQLTTAMNGTANTSIQNPNNMLNQMPFMNAPSALPNNNSNHGNINGQNQSMNPSQMGMQMTVFNPITNAWTTQQQPPQHQPQPQHQRQGQPNTNGVAGQNMNQSQGQVRSSNSTNLDDKGGGNDNGSFSYGGNLAHCA